jgi:hypothetical protein
MVFTSLVDNHLTAAGITRRSATGTVPVDVPGMVEARRLPRRRPPEEEESAP